MARKPRVVLAGAPHHITQRGNNRQNVFLTDHDRLLYVDLLLENCREYGVHILGYCVMTNHVHLIAVPDTATAFSRALQRAHSTYATRFNLRYGRSGHLWQNRFYSCILGRDHLVEALRYVDLNPVRAAMVGDALQYPWSSARAHAETRASTLIDWRLWRQVRGADQWADALRQPQDEAVATELRQATRTGRPVGSAHFVTKLEREFAVSFQPGKPGPKPRSTEVAVA